MTATCEHQFIDRDTGQVVTEKFIGDRCVTFLYNRLWENAPALFKILTSARMSSLLGYYHYDLHLEHRRHNGVDLLARLHVDGEECLDPPHYYDTVRKVFERKIRYQDVRPMDDDPSAVVSPADSRVLLGSLSAHSHLFIKDKFFSFRELLGNRQPWTDRFSDGDFAVFRLTPDKYHYNHLPVSGIVVDFFFIDGGYHCCNPSAVIAAGTPFSKNRRIVTIIDTDVKGGTGIGPVAMIEIVALMIGDIVQCYSEQGYNDPRPISPGMFLKKGCPKSLYRPGSSTDVLLFAKDRVDFSRDIIENQCRTDAGSRFTAGFSTPMVETDVRVRSTIGYRNVKS